MKEFIKSLSTEQKKGLLEILNQGPRQINFIHGLLEDHIDGDSQGYDQLFGKVQSSPANKSVSDSISKFTEQQNKAAGKSDSGSSSGSVLDSIKLFSQLNKNSHGQ